MPSYVYDASTGRGSNTWGLGTLLRDAETSTGQSLSADEWRQARSQILKSKKKAVKTKRSRKV
jgi:hypothetical protein